MTDDEPPPDPSPPPPLDPSIADGLLLNLVPGIGPRHRQDLLDHFGSATAALDAPLRDLRAVAGIGPKLAQAVAQARSTIAVAEELELCRRRGFQLLSPERPGYPPMLAKIHDPPGVLYVRGTIEPRDLLGVAIVGSRHATSYGKLMAERLAGSLARAGVTIVSGLARGIDAAAHRGALAAGGRTLAVLGSGLLQIYPPEHVDLADEVAAHGAVLSELPLRSKPTPESFPRRNRIIAGLALGVIVVEAAERSGALITARLAMEQGREVFAVPGRADSRLSHGCHRLIRDGAALTESADDVLETLGPLIQPAPAPVADRPDVETPVRRPAELLLNDIERIVLDALDDDPRPADAVIARTGLAAEQVLSTFSVLEVRRLIRRHPGQLFSRR